MVSCSFAVMNHVFFKYKTARIGRIKSTLHFNFMCHVTLFRPFAFTHFIYKINVKNEIFTGNRTKQLNEHISQLEDHGFPGLLV